MTARQKTTSRRAFFLSSGAALGAGVAGTAGAALLKGDASKGGGSDAAGIQRQLETAQAREAIRQLHLRFVEHMEQQRYEAAAGLFDARARLQLSGAAASGHGAIEQLFQEQYRCQQAPCLHGAYRHTAQQRHDSVTVAEDGRHARATFHVEVELVSPLQGESSVATMARLQGHVADRRWESGRFEASYVRSREGGWAIASLEYVPG